MHAGTLSIKDIFGKDCRYMVPLFQRPYVWNVSDQWEPLWEDIRLLAEEILHRKEARPHFLGAIVLDQIPNPAGHLERRQVVDGQQRLTTIQILLEAFADICVEAGVDKYDRALWKLTRNDDPISEDPDEEFKVWPTNADRSHFCRVMRAESPAEVLSMYERSTHAKWIEHPIGDAYLFFHRQIEDWLNTVGDGDLETGVHALYSAVRDNVRVVAIDLTEEDDAQVIFETLNARGTPLLPSDLVKNFLFHKAEVGEKELKRLHDDYWARFDQDSDYWREEVGRGHARRARIDTFLQHYLALKMQSQVHVSRLYTDYRSYGERDLTDGVEGELRDLRRLADTYRSFEKQPSSSRTGVFFDRLRTMNVTSAYPFLLALFDEPRLEGEAEREAVLRAVESFLVRRMVCRLSTRGYGRLFIELMQAFTEAHDEYLEAVVSFLGESEGDARRWPDDKEFLENWMTVPVYSRLAQSRVRMLLEAIEGRLRTTKSEHLEFAETLTIEHLLPQSWQAHYPLPADVPVEKAQLEREKLLHTLGNLTLVTKSLNPAVSNGPWARKKEEILHHSALALNRGLRDTSEWNEEAVQSRGRTLFDEARLVWPGASEWMS